MEVWIAAPLQENLYTYLIMKIFCTFWTLYFNINLCTDNSAQQWCENELDVWNKKN